MSDEVLASIKEAFVLRSLRPEDTVVFRVPLLPTAAHGDAVVERLTKALGCNVVLLAGDIELVGPRTEDDAS